MNYSISSACATSNHCIGNAYELIQWGKQDVMFAGGGEELGGVREELRHVRGNRDRLLADLEARRCPVHKGGLCVIPIQLDKPAPAPEND